MNEKEMNKILEDSGALLKKKNQMYGNGNIEKNGIEGVTTRLVDKFERLKVLLSIKQKPQEDTIEDTWQDIIGYGVTGLMLQRGKWLADGEKS